MVRLRRWLTAARTANAVTKNNTSHTAEDWIAFPAVAIVRLYVVKPKIYMTLRKLMLIFPGRCAHVNGILRKPRNMISASSSESVRPYARWKTAVPGGKQANSIGA